MPIHLEDRKLVRRLLAGDEQAFDRFFEDNFSRLYRFALARLSGDSEVASELAQAALSKALRKIQSYRGEAALFTWLCAICRNETSDWLAKQGRYREHIVLAEDFAEIQAAVDSFHAPEQMSPDRHYRRVELLRLIQVALDRLPARYGDVLEWKYIEGHSIKEISVRLDIGTEATQSLLARAKRAFADVYSSMTQGFERVESELVKS